MNFTSQTNRKNLLQLLYLRLIAIIGQVATIFFVNYFLKISLPLMQMMLVVLSLATLSLTSFYSYKKQKNISDKRLFFELFFDVIAFSTQIYLSGGISNPFIFLFLLQVIIATILLRAIYAILIFAITVICYLWLSKNYQALQAFNHHSQEFFNLHLYGMLFSYIIAAILLLIFITKITKNLWEKERKIMSHEQIVRMGLLATGAAHRLGTPLSTIAILLNDLKPTPEIKTIEEQLKNCKKIISDMAFSYGNARAEEARKVKAKQGFEQLINDWKNQKNPINLIYNFSGEENAEIIFDDILIQSFFDIFDNALEASPNWVKIDVEVQKDLYKVSVQDRGPGFAKEILKNLGKPNLTTKNSSGLGLFLAISALERVGGKLDVKNLIDGAKVIITKNKL